MREESTSKFKCILCEEINHVPSKGFPVNKMVLKLLAESQSVALNLQSLEDLIEKLTFEIDNGEYLIKEYFSQLRRLVELVIGQRLEEIHAAKESLMLEINKY